MNAMNMTFADIQKQLQVLKKVDIGLCQLEDMIKGLKYTSTICTLPTDIEKLQKKLQELKAMVGEPNKKPKKMTTAAYLRGEIKKLLCRYSRFTSREIFDQLILEKHILHGDKNYSIVRTVLNTMKKMGMIRKTTERPCNWLWNQHYKDKK